MPGPEGWSWNMKRAGIVFQMPGEGRISVQESELGANRELRKAISALCKAFFKTYPKEARKSKRSKE